MYAANAVPLSELTMIRFYRAKVRQIHGVVFEYSNNSLLTIS